MSLIDTGVKNLKAIGFGAALPKERDQLLGMITGDKDKAQEERIKALEAEVAAGRKTKAQAEMEASNTSAMRKGGKVKSASARADGIAIRGKTRA